ncbi:MAG TPA: uracil-DNA glycosylase family protein [Hyphomicrobium sp.]|nr:uracil-DNA glycosylase family protein [Hyphomicrobium sp.]
MGSDSASDKTPEMTARLAAGRILAWYAAMGVDAALAEEPVDWMVRGEAAPGARFSMPVADGASPAAGSAHPRAPSPGPAPPIAPRQGYVSTTAPARPSYQPPPARQFTGAPAMPAGLEPRVNLPGVRTLEDLGAALSTFDGCGLKATAKNLCFYRGAERAPLLIIGEAPGRDEDLEGKPFVGRAGQLLDRMLAAIDMGEANVHITNIVYWRPPGNRTPTPQEALACRPFLERQIALVGPKVVLALGGSAAKQLFDVPDGIMRLRGKWRTLEAGGREIKAMATLHPAYLLRTPAAKGMVWRDLLAVKAALKV